MSFKYIIKRILLFFAIIWAAASLNFFIPRMASDRDPIREKLGQLAATGGLNVEGLTEMVEAYQEKFGLDKPILQQYVTYLGDVVRLDFGFSMSLYPTKVVDLIAQSLPWTLGLITVATLMAFIAGTVLGALVAWPGSPRWIQILIVPFMTFSAFPYYLLGLILLYLFAVQVKVFPLFGAYPPTMQPGHTSEFYFAVIHHATLPALSMVLSGIGFWGLSMWGMMVTTMGEDYVVLAEANGLRQRDIFFRYGMRNAILPQATALALSLGFIVSGSVLVEVVFAYPGIGQLLFQAIQSSDFFLIYGIVFFIIVSIGIATMLIDFTYPLLDPRIRIGQKD